jgi:hypothetical protein
MRILDAKKMESSSKIDLKDVSWWMSIKDACKLGVLGTVRFSKTKCNSLAIGGGTFCIAHKHD